MINNNTASSLSLDVSGPCLCAAWYVAALTQGSNFFHADVWFYLRHIYIATHAVKQIQVSYLKFVIPMLICRGTVWCPHWVSLSLSSKRFQRVFSAFMSLSYYLSQTNSLWKLSRMKKHPPGKRVAWCRRFHSNHPVIIFLPNSSIIVSINL